tara:strand:+ start:9996 stop:10736 length:741 start_codon:yes stop_codon:yes gene_type:complete
MSNKDDYTYPEDSSSNTEYAESASNKQTENIQSILMNKRMLIPVGIIAMIFVINFLFSEDEPEAAPVEPAMQSVGEAELPAPEPAPVPVVSQDAQDAMTRSIQHGEEINKVSETNSRQDQDIESVVSKNNQLSNSVRELTADVAQLHNDLRNTQATIAVLINRLEQMDKPKPKPVPKKVIIQRHFSIRAIVDGRAWIRDNKDHTVTMSISVGDEIPTYGRVVSIHSLEGIVQTSSGRVIQFPANER